MVIIGNRASGKTTLGRKLSYLLDLPFFDSDEEMGIDIKEFVENDERMFRQIEAATIHDLLKRENCIIALGGGAPTTPEVQKMLEECSHRILWVKCAEGKRLSRLGLRPHVDDSGRDSIYSDLADETITVD